MIRHYWQQPPTTQRTIIDSIEEQRAAEDAEGERIVGYITTIEGEDSTMYPREQDKDVIVCTDCFSDPCYGIDENTWELITEEEYLDEGNFAFKAKCEDCGRRLLPGHPFK